MRTRKIVVRFLSILGANASLIAAGFFYNVAVQQHTMAGTLSANASALEKLAYLSHLQNFWGASAALLAALCLFLAMLIND
jgi:hypothetical protein